MEMFTVYADDGEYTEEAENIGMAWARFIMRRPDSHPAAIVSDEMRPRLVLEECDKQPPSGTFLG